jgi:hypothetical protein
VPEPAPRKPANTHQNRAKPAAIAKIAKNDPLPGKTRPNTTINGAAAKLNTGISQAHSILSAPTDGILE